jgi:calcium channel MID1
MSWQGNVADNQFATPTTDDSPRPTKSLSLLFCVVNPSLPPADYLYSEHDSPTLVVLAAHPLRSTNASCIPGSIDKVAERAMQRPKPSPLQSRLLVYLVVAFCCLALWTSYTPRFLACAAELPTTPDYNPLNDLVLHAPANDDLLRLEEASSGSGGGAGYEPDFGYLDRSLIGRQAAEVDKLTNDEKMEKDIDPQNIQYFVLEKNQLRLRRVVDIPLEALETRGTDNGSEEAVLDVLEGTERDGIIDEGAENELAKRQAGSSRVWLTANTCRQPMPNGNVTNVSKNHPQLVMYVSNSTRNQKPGPAATQNTITNKTGILFDSGYISFEFNTSSDVYIGIAAPKLEDDWFGSWHYELAASTDGPYHSYNESDPFLYMIDTDSESTLFITYDLGDSNSTDVVNQLNKSNPFKMYAFEAGDYTPITGMEHSYCALKEQFNVNTTRNFTIDSNITTKFSGDDRPKTQFHVRNLQNAKTYNGFVVVEGGQEPFDIPGVGMVRGGGKVFQAFNWTTKAGTLHSHRNSSSKLTSTADDSCQVLSDLTFCDMVAYAVPSNTLYKYNDSGLAEIYDTKAREYYDGFNKSLQQVACDTTSEAQYSLARTCDDCARDYKNWLCLVLIPRCEDWSASDRWLWPRNINGPLPNGTLPYHDNTTSEFQDSHRDRHAFNQSRNPLIDDQIKPGPYKEMLPCEDMCFDIVRSCPAQLGFACPNQPGMQSAYGKKDENSDTLTCNFPGAVVKLNVQGGAGILAVNVVNMGFVGMVVGMMVLV